MKTLVFRGQTTPVNNFLSSFGEVKETRLSSILGYLISLEPKIGEDLFNLKSSITKVFLEKGATNSSDRNDLMIFTSDNKTHCIEIKIDRFTDRQLNRYYKEFKSLHVIGNHEQINKTIKDKLGSSNTWQDVVKVLKPYLKSKKTNHDVKFLITNIISYLGENRMIKHEFKDIYIRDLSGTSVDVYFSQNFYQCQSKFFDSISKCRYFAPYLSKSNQRGERESIYKVLGIGISYFSKIKSVNLLKGSEITAFLKLNDYTKQHIDKIFDNSEDLRKSGKQQRTIILLEDPIRLVQKPITKKELLGINSGAIIYAADFGDLMYAAANGIKKIKKAS